MQYANNKGDDQPAHLRSLISACVVRCLDTCSRVVEGMVTGLEAWCHASRVWREFETVLIIKIFIRGIAGQN